MLKFMKYEIKGTYKFIMTLIIAILGASTGLQLSALRQLRGDSSSFPVFLPAILGLVIFGAFISAFFYIVSSFRKELYEDRGYLTFSLPISGRQLVSTKLCIALMWSIAIGLAFVLYNLVLGSMLFGIRWIEGIKPILSFLPIKIIITLGITGILSSIISLLLMYFSIAVSKVSIKNKKIGGLWFILFLVLTSVINYVILKVGGLFPYYLDIDSFKVIKHSMSIFSDATGFSLEVLSGGNMQGLIVATGNKIILNVAAYVLSILVAVGAIFGTGYLIDKKVEI